MAVATVLSLCGGCASDDPWVERSEGERQANEIVALATREMARSLATIDPGFASAGPLEVVGDPVRTRELRVALEAAGYAVERGAPRTLDYRVVREVGNDGVAISYTLALDGMRLEREYRLGAGGELERGPLREGATGDGASARQEELGEVPAGSGADPSGALALERNVALSPAAWDTMPEGFALVSAETVIFERGMIDAAATAGVARRLAGVFDESRDTIRLAGCSQGRTTAEEGNEGLARKRSAAMRSSLERAGVNPGAVLTAPCWAPRVVAPSMPSRGVVIQHLRAVRSAGGAR